MNECPICQWVFVGVVGIEDNAARSPDTPGWCASCRASFVLHDEAPRDPEAAARWAARRCRQATERIKPPRSKSLAWPDRGMVVADRAAVLAGRVDARRFIVDRVRVWDPIDRPVYLADQHFAIDFCERDGSVAGATCGHTSPASFWSRWALVDMLSPEAEERLGRDLVAASERRRADLDEQEASAHLEEFARTWKG